LYLFRRESKGASAERFCFRLWQPGKYNEKVAMNQGTI